MREIKFRAWDIENKLIVIPDYISGDGIVYEHAHYEPPQCINAILMQFTGLKDKNGKEIYEGDIVKVRSDGKIMTISWSEKFASFVINREGWAFQHWFGEAMAPNDCEVIGNIYENPDLLGS